MAILSDQIFSQAQDCLLEKMDNDVLLYNPTTTQTLHLNESSAVVWQLIDGKSSVMEVIQALQQQFPESSDQIGKDVMDVLLKMQENRVIVSEPV